MEGLALAAALIVGLPLTFISLGFFIVAVKVFRGGDRAERLQTLEAARRLERALSGLESRLGALEDIILTSAAAPGGRNSERT
jgi:hypothetical protein